MPLTPLCEVLGLSNSSYKLAAPIAVCKLLQGPSAAAQAA